MLSVKLKIHWCSYLMKYTSTNLETITQLYQSEKCSHTIKTNIYLAILFIAENIKQPQFSSVNFSKVSFPLAIV